MFYSIFFRDLITILVKLVPNVSYWQPCPECFLPANYHRLFPSVFLPFSDRFPPFSRTTPEPSPNESQLISRRSPLVQIVTVVFEPALIASPVLVHLNEQL